MKMKIGSFGLMVVIMMTSLILLVPDRALAQIPSEMNYQGRLISMGQPVTGTHDFIFSIYNQKNGRGRPLDGES